MARPFERTLFAATLLLAAVLLFTIEPLVARMLLPLAGGSASVWNACLAFFQASLLLGYAWAHVSIRVLGVRRQALVHVTLLALAATALPIAIAPSDLPASVSPVVGIIIALTRRLLFPFVAIAATAPTLQRWYAARAPESDPYPLYAASNAGSLAALLIAPLVLDRLSGIRAQASLWRAAYLALTIAISLSAITLRGVRDTRDVGGHAPIRAGRELRWIVLAAIPSSLLVGVTQYLATDIVSIPLLWVIPLALYLITFMLAFVTRPPLDWRRSSRAIVLPATAVTLVLSIEANNPALLVMVVHLAMFFLACMLCHAALAADRPEPAALTRFFLAVSIGGAIGGAFNAFIAPVLFRGVYEYPIAMCAALAMRAPVGTLSNDRRSRLYDWLWPACLWLVTFASTRAASRWLPSAVGLGAGVVFALPLFAAMRENERPLRFALCLAAILVGAASGPGPFGHVVFQARSFYGVVRVAIDARDGVHRLVHGSTVHGIQDPAHPDVPGAYYHPDGPAGAIFRAWRTRPDGEIGIVGLGAGALATYAQLGDAWTFFELDPLVATVAQDPRYFTFVRDGMRRARTHDIVPGDARRSLARVHSARFGLLVLDAFSSDTIPVHLLVREAFALYRRVLRPDGLLAIHISNRYFDLRPRIGAAARELGLSAKCFDDRVLAANEIARGHAPSVWCVMTAPSHGWPVFESPPWMAPPVAIDVWTDDHAFVLDALRL